MTDTDDAPPVARVPLTRDRVVRAAVTLADADGLGAVSMRRLGQELGVEAMSLYNHVSNKEDLLDGMAEYVIDAIERVEPDDDWKAAARAQMLAAREVMYLHPWAPDLFESRVNMTPTMLGYFDSLIGILRHGGLSLDLIHHSMHVLGSRLLGFTQELFDDSDASEHQDEMVEALMTEMADVYPNLVAMMALIVHDDESILGEGGCDDQVEFVFAVDLMLDGIEQRHQAELAG